MRYLSLCSGIEAATVAWHPMGWEPAAFAEIEAFPAAVLKHHYPNTPNLGDMTKWREWNVGAIDLLVGGTPCQSFSVAGLRKGLSDPRGGLMLTFLEIAQSLRPRWVVWENVPGVLSSGGGRDFGAFLGALGELGYGWAYRVLDAQWCRVDGYERAVPQRRRRVFVVGCLGDATRAAQVLFQRQSVERNPAPRRAKGQGAAADAEDGARAGGCYWDGSDCAATLTKKNAGGDQRMPDKANFGAVLQPICIDRSAYNQGQNAQWDCPIEQSDAMFGLIARGPHAVAHGFYSTGGTHGVNMEPEVSPAVKVGSGLGIPSPPAVAFKPSHFTRGKDGSPADITPPLSADADKGDQDTVVAFNRYQRTEQAAVWPIGASDGRKVEVGIRCGMVVRRLTPVECERLQGFPDDYTNIPWRGKPESPDGPRYKALGNSMAVNCMRWIGRRIDAVEKGTELPA